MMEPRIDCSAALNRVTLELLLDLFMCVSSEYIKKYMCYTHMLTS